MNRKTLNNLPSFLTVFCAISQTAGQELEMLEIQPTLRPPPKKKKKQKLN